MVAAVLSLATMTAQQAPKGKDANKGQAEQKRPDGKARLMQQTKIYVAEFALDEAQAEKFTELYHAYNKKLHEIHAQYRHERPAEGAEPTEEQVERRILDNFAQSRAILDVREQYYKEFRKLLTPKQVNKIFMDEKARRAQMRGKAHTDNPRPQK